VPQKEEDVVVKKGGKKGKAGKTVALEVKGNFY
jgi:hypothetical protein